MQIKTNVEAFKNATLNLPIVGEVTVQDGVLEVSDDVAELLLNGDNWKRVADEEEIANDLKNITGEGADTIEDELTHLTLEEMIDLAKEAKLKGFQLFTKDESRMRAFLRKKLKTASAATATEGEE